MYKIISQKSSKYSLAEIFAKFVDPSTTKRERQSIASNIITNKKFEVLKELTNIIAKLDDTDKTAGLFMYFLSLPNATTASAITDAIYAKKTIYFFNLYADLVFGVRDSRRLSQKDSDAMKTIIIDGIDLINILLKTEKAMIKKAILEKFTND